MSFAIVAGIGVGASLLATGYSIYSQEQAQQRAKQIADKAASDEQQAQLVANQKKDLFAQQSAQTALRQQQMQGVGYTRSGTILSDGLGLGTQGSGKTLLGQ